MSSANERLAFRDSGIPWLGTIPAHWAATRLKFVAEVQGGLTLGKNYGAATLMEYPYLRVANVQDGYLDLSDVATILVPGTEAESCLLKAGDVLMNEGGDADKLGRGCIWTGEIAPCLHQNHVFAVRPRLIHFEWLNVWTSTEAAKAFFESRAKQSTNLASISATNIKELPIPVPPVDEQRAIADYLGRETARLDGLVAAKECVLRLVAEKRRALITRAVTRGLDPGVPLRDSGIPWLGEIPAHWDVQRLKFLVLRIEQGWSPECHNIPASDEEWGVLKAGCCNGGVFNQQENKSLPLNLAPPLDLEVQPGDILMSRASGSTALIGSVALVPEDTRPRLLLSDKTYRMWLDTTRVIQSYFVITLGSDIGRVQVQEVISGAAGLANNIAQSDIKEFAVPLPPLNEQAAIVAHITAETAKLDALRTATERTIALLKERRAALIAAAVTGKINVQGEIA